VEQEANQESYLENDPEGIELTEMTETEQGVPPALGETSEGSSLKLNLKKKFSSVGINLGDNYIKMVQLKNVDGKPEVNQYHFMSLPEEAMDIDGEKVEDPLLLGNRIRIPFRKRYFKKNRVNLSISGKGVILRQVFLPYMTSKEMPQAVRWEAEKHIMIPLEELILDYFTLGERSIDGNRVIELVLVAVPRDTITGYMKALSHAGLYPDAVEIDALSLHRATALSLKMCGQETFDGDTVTSEDACTWSDNNYLVLDVGRNCSTLLLMEGDRYSFSRTINTGVQDFLNQVMETQGLNQEKAESFLYRGEPLKIEEVYRVAEMLVDQVNRSLEYYYYKMYRQGMDFNWLLMCGEGCFIKGLGLFLGENLNTAPRLLNPFHYLNWGKRFNAEDINRDGPYLGATYGAALKGWLK